MPIEMRVQVTCSRLPCKTPSPFSDKRDYSYSVDHPIRVGITAGGTFNILSTGLPEGWGVDCDSNVLCPACLGADLLRNLDREKLGRRAYEAWRKANPCQTLEWESLPPAHGVHVWGYVGEVMYKLGQSGGRDAE